MKVSSLCLCVFNEQSSSHHNHHQVRKPWMLAVWHRCSPKGHTWVGKPFHPAIRIGFWFTHQKVSLLTGKSDAECKQRKLSALRTGGWNIHTPGLWFSGFQAGSSTIVHKRTEICSSRTEDQRTAAKKTTKSTQSVCYCCDSPSHGTSANNWVKDSKSPKLLELSRHSKKCRLRVVTMPWWSNSCVSKCSGDSVSVFRSVHKCS